MARRHAFRYVVVAALAVGACDAATGPAAPPAPPPRLVTTTEAAVPATTPGTAAPLATAGPTAVPPATDGAVTAVPPATVPGTATTTTGPPPLPTSTVPIGELTLALEPVATDFTQPVLVAAPPGDERLFVVDQPGSVWVIDHGEVSEFLDIAGAVRFRGEQGLLGMAFHPQFASNGLFYLHFSNDRGATVVAEFAVDPADPNRARPESRRDVLTVAQPAANHNGGMIAFGPDGLLWLGLGDGGGSNDRYQNGQRSDRRLASMIRVAVGPGEPEPFGAPADGPFVADGGLPEVWSIGLRNPWRWTFDSGLLYIADVGQNRIEEINIVPADEGGLNFGWPVLEGEDCFRSAGCDRTGYVLPAVTYTHADGCSVTGGFVYRGSAVPELSGHYFYGDYCSGWVASIVADDSGAVVERHEWFTPGTVPGLTSFGFDGFGEIYLTTTSGVVYRIARSNG